MADRQVGPYQLVRQIAVGGMAEIHLAKTQGVAGFPLSAAALPTASGGSGYLLSGLPGSGCGGSGASAGLGSGDKPPVYFGGMPTAPGVGSGAFDTSGVSTAVGSGSGTIVGAGSAEPPSLAVLYATTGGLSTGAPNPRNAASAARPENPRSLRLSCNRAARSAREDRRRIAAIGRRRPEVYA